MQTLMLLASPALIARAPSLQRSRGSRALLSMADKPPLFLDEEAALAASSFPISPDELISKTRAWALSNNGVEEPSMLADSFQFVGPVVGPLGKDEYLEAVGGFNIYEAFPDLSPRLYDFRADPYEPGRVWYTSRVTGTFSGPFANGAIQPTGKGFEMPPEAISVTWNAEGKATKFTIGVCMDRSVGDSEGLGGIFGILYAVGRPFPFREANPWRKSLGFKLFDIVGNLAQAAQRKQASSD